MTKYILALLAILYSTVPALADEAVFDRVMKTKTLNCGYIVWPPYIAKDSNTGKLSGINYDMVEAIGRNLGLKVNWTMEVGVGDVSTALAADKFDVMCQTMWPSPARYSAMTLANRPQFYSAIYAVARVDDHRFDGDLSKADNKDIKAAGIEGDFSADLVNEKLPRSEHVFLPASASPADFLMQLTTKKADILFVDKGGINEFSKTNPGLLKIVAGIPPARVFGEHLAVKLGEYKLRDMIDLATLQLINDGVFETLVKKYAKEYNTDIYPAAKDIAR